MVTELPDTPVPSWSIVSLVWAPWSFTIDDIGIVNGTIDSGSFTKVSETQYAIRVTPSPGGKHSNVAITVAANTFTNIAGNAKGVCVRKHILHISHITNIPIANILVKFCKAYVFNQDIGSWDVSKVTDMYHMFSGAHAFNQDIRNWDISKVSIMSWMFYETHIFNQDISKWDVSKVTDMDWMFGSSKTFNQNIGHWEVGKVTNMDWMFINAEAFNQNIGHWNISSLTGATRMFNGSAMTMCSVVCLAVVLSVSAS
jgi:surface protein